MKSLDLRSPSQDSLFLGFLGKEVVSIRGAMASANREETHCTVKTIVGHFMLTLLKEVYYV